jgi:hypothetical protein
VEGKIVKWAFRLLKAWGYFFIFVLVGQIRYGSRTLESRFHDYINEPEQAQFFIKILTPVHALLAALSYPIDQEEIDRIQNLKIVKPLPSSPFLSPEKLEQMRESSKERQRILKEAEQP